MIETALDYRVLQNYLKIRGLDPSSVILSKAKIEFAGPSRCREVLGLKPDSSDRRLGIIFHYPSEAYASVRWFGKASGPYGSVIERKADVPYGRPLEIYKSPLIEWETFEGTLYLCESVLKALVLSQHGYAAMAGNGVWGLCPKGQLLLPEELMSQVKRVVILFDNDWKRNPQVRASIRKLGNLIKTRYGIEVKHGRIPDPPVGGFYWDAERGKSAGKWGVDDAIYTLGIGPLMAAIELVDIEPTERELVLDELNDRYAVCAHPPCIIRLETGNKYSRADFTGLLEAHRRLWINEKLVEASRLWLAYEDRSNVERVAYLPGGEQYVRGEYYNEWKDTGPRPMAGNIAPFVRVFENAIPDQMIRDLLFKSLAWVVQNRGIKMNKTFVFVGRQVGTGKSLLARTFGRVLGESNFATIGMEDFESDFNSAFAAKEFVLIDDLHRMGAKDVAKLKRYTTADRIVVNAKNLKQYEVDNYAVFCITTNEYAAIVMDDVERRNLVVAFDPVVHYETGSTWWNEIIEWLDGVGLGIVRGWLEGMNLDGFDPNYMPPMTATKAKMISMGRSEEENMVLSLWQERERVLGENQRSVYTTEELWFVLFGTIPLNSEKQRFSNVLGNKFNQCWGGKTGRFFAGKNPCRLWAIRQGSEKWTIEQCKMDIEKHRVLR